MSVLTELKIGGDVSSSDGGHGELDTLGGPEWAQFILSSTRQLGYTRGQTRRALTTGWVWGRA